MEAALIRLAGAGVIGELATYAVAFVGACLHYTARVRRAALPLSFHSFLRHMLPHSVLTSRWTWLDMTYAVIDKLLVPPLIAGSLVSAGRLAQGTMSLIFGHGPALPITPITLTAFLLSGLLVRDFMAFYVHLLQHRIPLLWEFHKVHHAPESLVPPTSRRLHVVDQVLGMAAELPLTGLVVGCYAWLTDAGWTAVIASTLGFYYLANIVTFAPLRHSHIDLRFGVLEHVILSPAHHRLHHSVERPHWDKNFAAIFPFWDRMFGTLVAPPPASEYRLGLPNGESARYATLLSCYLEPLVAIRNKIARGGLRPLLRPRAFDTTPKPATRGPVGLAGPIGSVDPIG